MQKVRIERLDETGVLTEENEKHLHDYLVRFRKVYGFSMQVWVRKTPFPQDVLQRMKLSGALLLGLCPDAREVVFYAPPLASGLLGQTFIDHMRFEHFTPYFENGTWPVGLAKALSLLTQKLDEAIEPDTKGGTP